ncbi:hypothetical protein HFN60_30045 [Rhizobium leguminosarum]|uniref:hypothetical protein n=1 Tax=Rhizobium leguminosarum TaxID=384 RepID=UPI001C9824AC|nr:hypothetical protein [Rhizobium leguminosarum]MBY5819837.1 hypothetical protein [Rhizobium leguminosarum]
MKPDKIETLRKRHPWYFDASVATLPDGWFHAVDHFLSQLKEIGDLADCVVVRFERMPYGLQAFVAPWQFNWTGESALALLKAQEALLLASQSLCEVCGLSGVTALPGSTERAPASFFCEEHLPSAAAQVEQEKALWADLGFLFADGPPSLDPSMPEDIRKIAFDYLGKIAAQVREWEQVGYVHIRIAFEDGLLVMRPTYIPGYELLVGMEITELCSTAGELADTRPYIQDWTDRARAIFGSLIGEGCVIRLTSRQFYILQQTLKIAASMDVDFVLKDCIDWNPGYEVDYDCGTTTPFLEKELDGLMSTLVVRLGFTETDRPILPEAPGGRP